MSILPHDIPLDLAKIDTGKGTWLVAVANVTETQGGKNLLLKLILEQRIDEETFRSRDLGLMVPAALILDPETLSQVIEGIRTWIETIEGDGFLDLVRLRR